MPPSLLDTDVLSELIRRKNATVVANALEYVRRHGQIAYSAITRYEILRGYKQQNATTQISRFRTFCEHALILPVTDDVFERASDLWAYGRLHGLPHADVDLIIAATALTADRCLVTGNTAHFKWIPGLSIVDCRQP